MFSLSEIVCDFSIEAELKKKTEKKKLEEARYSSELRTPVCHNPISVADIAVISLSSKSQIA